MEPSLACEHGCCGFNLGGVREFLELNVHGMVARLRALLGE
jgi:hypothetical protein